MGDEREPGASAPKRLLRSAGRPLTGYFDQRFADLHRHVDHRADALEHRIDALQAEVERIGSGEQIGKLAETTAALQELTETIRRFADRFADRAGEVAEAFAELLARAERLDGATHTDTGP